MRLSKSFFTDDGVTQKVADLQIGELTLAGTTFATPRGGDMGVVIVVGGPQCRIGSHRQNVHLGHAAALAGFPTLVFDHRGIGDSPGSPRPYFELYDDIAAAIDGLTMEHPHLRGVVLWSLCDGATASALYAPTDPRILGVVLVNPWLEPGQGHARSKLRRYYAPRLLSRSLWRDMVRGNLDLRHSLPHLIGEFRRALGRTSHSAAADPPTAADVADALAYFRGAIHLMVSSNDITAQGFLAEMAKVTRWHDELSRTRVHRHDIEGADHTCSQPESHQRLMAASLSALTSIDAAGASLPAE